MAWELANEPNIEPQRLLKSWIADMAGFVKSIDPRHLITSGRSNSRSSNTDFDVSALDFLSWHGYPAYKRIRADRFDRVISSYCAAPRTLHKPVPLHKFANS